MTEDQLARFVLTAIGIGALWWALRRIAQDIRGIGGLAGASRRLGYAVGRLCRRLLR